MNGKAFIRMMREDIETHKDKNVLSGVVDVMECLLYHLSNKNSNNTIKKE